MTGDRDQPEEAPPKGVAAIAGHLETLPFTPGVYRMLDGAGKVLYVGKAKSLKKRVAAYTKPDRLTARIRRMVAETVAMEFVTTHTEAEALLLEANLIKRFQPRYNILLRDDKSFPSILLTGGHPFPRVVKHRGAQSQAGEYFGPFASAWAVTETLSVLQRAFLLRSCTDSVFEGRTRPCLLHQIKRCSAPCVGRIAEADYAALVAEARAFLKGDSRRIQDALAVRMQEASDALDFEAAAQFRDRIRALARIQAHQDINPASLPEADVIAAHQQGGQTAIQVFFFRAGRNFGNRAYFPNHAADEEIQAVLEAFIGQFYASRPPPSLVLVSHELPNRVLVEEALSVHAGRRIQVARPLRGDKRKVLEHALANARDALVRRLAEGASQRQLLEALAMALDLEGPPTRIEIYDNSHVQGSLAVGGMVVAGPEGFVKAAYRKFNIRGADLAPGDDYAMMREMLTRRFARAQKEDPDRGGGQWPDLVLVDGGGGHLAAARGAMADLGIEDVALAAIAKGPDRNAGRERIFLPDRPEPLVLERRDPVLYFLQRLRDEAHRFAIGSHRDRRARAATTSPLDEIPGIGARRKKALLLHFGSARTVAEAGLKDLEGVAGISATVARRIYDWFHGGA
ncbi:MAG: excinuclease ABC subunit UvrC [Magnetospirillum sp. WYHS-4]